MSLRKCDFCKEPTFGVVNKVVNVNPYYSYNIRSVKSPEYLCDIPNVDIEEKFICPKCGQINIKTYSFTPNQEDLKYFVDKLISKGNQ